VVSEKNGLGRKRPFITSSANLQVLSRQAGQWVFIIPNFPYKNTRHKVVQYVSRKWSG
jgi:hypothetical protein